MPRGRWKRELRANGRPMQGFSGAVTYFSALTVLLARGEPDRAGAGRPQGGGVDGQAKGSRRRGGAPGARRGGGSMDRRTVLAAMGFLMLGGVAHGLTKVQQNLVPVVPSC